MCDRLKWPDSVSEPKKIKKGFFGACVHIISEEALDSIRKQLETRTEECLHQWGDFPRRIDIARKVARIIADYFNWPNDLFLPDDPYGIIALTFPCVLDDEYIMRMERVLQASLSDSFWSRIQEDGDILTFGEIVNLLCDQMSSR